MNVEQWETVWQATDMRRRKLGESGLQRQEGPRRWNMTKPKLDAALQCSEWERWGKKANWASH
jgi:hypothetical protein